MRILILTLVLLLTVQFVYGQKLRLDTFDHETKQIIKETEWIKVEGEHRTHLKIKFKRIGDEVKLYCTLNRPRNDGPTSEKDRMVIMLSNGEQMEVPLVETEIAIIKAGLEERIYNEIHGIVRTPKLTDVPDAITSAALTSEQLSRLASNAIPGIDVYFYRTKDVIHIKEKYRDALKAQVALMR